MKGLSNIAWIVCLALCFLAQMSQAQTTFTSNGDGDWDNPGTWDETGDDDPDDIPDSNDIVIISAGHTVSMTTSGTFDADDLTINGTLDFPSNNRTLNVGGNLVMSGTSSVTGNNNNRILNVTGTFTVSASATATITGIQINITGTTTLDGELAFTSTRGDKSMSTIDVNATGHWNNNSGEDFVISGNIINDGTWTGCSGNNCTYDLTSTTGTISGSGTITMADILINSPASITNNGTVLLTDDLTGTGTLTNGATGDFQIQGTGPFTLSTIDFTTAGNTVTYTNSGNTTMLTETYHNLVVAKTAGQRAQLTSTITVNNDLTVSSGEFRMNASGIVNVGGDLLVTGGEYASNNSTAVTNVTGNINMSTGTIDHNDGDVNVTGDLIITGGTMTMNQGATTSTFDVDDFTLSTGTVTLAEGEFNVNNAAGGLTVNSGSLTLSNASITLDVAGTYQVSGGTNDLNNGNLNVVTLTIDNGEALLLGGATAVITGTTTANGTLTVDGTGGTKTFNDLTVSATGNWNVTVAESFTINGNISSNGTWAGCSNSNCIYTLTSSSGAISGSTQVSVGTMTIDNPGSYTSTGSVLINNDFLGTGSFTNGNGSTLELNGGGPFSISTLDASTNSNTVTYSGGSNVTVNGATYHNLTINKSGNTATISSATTVNNNLTVSGAILALGAATLDVTNDIIINGGEFSPNDAGAVANVGGNISMSSGLYDQNDGDVNVTGDFIVTGGTMTLNQGTTSTIDADDFSIATGSATLNSGTMNVTGATGLSVTSGSLVLSGVTLTVTNAYDLDGGTNDFNSGTFSAASLDIASSQELTVASPTFTISGATNINGTLTFDNNNGTKTFGDINVNSGGIWSNNTSADFTINGNIVSNGTSWTGCSGNGCNYTLTSSSGTISGSTALGMSDLLIDAPASYTNIADLSITDRITGTGSFINGASASLNYSGNNGGGSNFDITNFTASAAGNTVTFSGGTDQQLRTTTDADNNYHNVVISTTAAGFDVTLAGDITIDNQLTLTLGDLFLSSNRLTIDDGTTISGGSADSYIGINGSGVLRQNYTAAGATLAFPMGDADDFSPITAFTINSATFGAGAYLEFDITDADHPNRNTSNTPTGDDDGTAAVDFISRYWTVTPNNITGPEYNADYVYVDADITGTESNMVGALYRIQPTLGILDWFVTGTVNPTNNTVSLENADAFGDMYAMDNTLSRLPIVLVSFDGRYVDGMVELNWVTASEENNAFFTIERSVDGIDFEEVVIREGAGNSQGTREYRATDVNPPVGRVFYRLKQTDFNGTFEYSELISVDVLATNGPLSFSIPGNVLSVGEMMTIRRNQQGAALLNMISMDGQAALSLNLTEAESREFEVRLPATAKKGMYVLQLYQNGEKVSRKLIIR